MIPLNEELLCTWLRVSTSIINSRVVSELPYNEALVCNILYQNSFQNNNEPMTATELCNRTNMLKSQMNRTLNLLEDKGIITRERSKEDKRQVLILFDFENALPYKKQHEKVLEIVDRIIDELGEERAKEVANTLAEVADLADDIINQE